MAEHEVAKLWLCFRNVDVTAPLEAAARDCRGVPSGMRAAVRDCRGVPSGMHRRKAGRGMRFHSHGVWRLKDAVKF